MSLLFNYCTSIAKNESPSKIFVQKIYLYGFLIQIDLILTYKTQTKTSTLSGGNLFYQYNFKSRGSTGNVGLYGL